MKKNAQHMKSTLARPPIYDQAYPKKLVTVSPGNIPVGFTKPSLFLLFVEQDKKSLEESTVVRQPFYDNFRKKPLR